MKRTCLAFLALAVAGCAASPEITAWNDSGHADEASKMVGKAKIEQILKADSVGECIRIVKSNSDPKIAATVADLAFKATPQETLVKRI